MADNQRHIAKSRQKFTRKVLSLSMKDSSAAYHLWLKLPQQWSVDDFIASANQENILVSHGDHFSASKTPSGHIRLALMGIEDEKKFQQGIYAIKHLLDNPSHSNASD